MSLEFTVETTVIAALFSHFSVSRSKTSLHYHSSVNCRKTINLTSMEANKLCIEEKLTENNWSADLANFMHLQRETQAFGSISLLEYHAHRIIHISLNYLLLTPN